jgi:hypothetical protein
MIVNSNILKVTYQIALGVLQFAYPEMLPGTYGLVFIPEPPII